MEEVLRRRPSRRRIVFLIIGAMIFTIGSFGLWIWWTAEQRWKNLRVEVNQIFEREVNRPRQRPVLRGVAEPGNAWDEYKSALALIGAMSDKDGRLLENARSHLRGYRGWGRVDWNAVGRIVESLPKPLEHLRRGASRSTTTLRYPSLDYNFSSQNQFSRGSRLCSLAVLRARALSRQGKGSEAAELLLDLSLFGLDVSAACGERLWNTPIHACLEELSRLILSNHLSDDDLLEVARELEVLDLLLPDETPLEAKDLMAAGIEFLESEHLFWDIRGRSYENLNGAVLPLWGAWRYAFSDRLMVADAFRERMEQVRVSDKVRGASWTRIQQVALELQQARTQSPNPLFSVGQLPGRVWLPIWSRYDRTGLRLLRMASTYRATGEILEVQDPFGTGPLRHQEEACRLRLWSVGKDGVDNHGNGVWIPNQIGPEKDTVLEVDR